MSNYNLILVPISLTLSVMRDLLMLFVHLIVTLARLMGPGGAKAIVAENLLMKQQLLVACRARQRAPRLSTLDRFLFGFWSLFLSTRRRVRAAILLTPSTLLRFHAALVERQYHRLFTPRTRTKPGPKGPSQELIHTIVVDPFPMAAMLPWTLRVADCDMNNNSP